LVVCGCFQNFGDRFNSYLFAKLMDWADGWYRSEKNELLPACTGRVLDVGGGAGANFRYYPKGTEVVALEPNRHMHRHLRDEADRYELQLEITDSKGEAMPFSDGEFSVVVGTLVLCSVRNVRSVVGEIARVLKPGGKYHFIEHVAGRGLCAAYQRLAWLPWRMTFGGCDLRVPTGEILSGDTAFECQLKRVFLGPRSFPIRPHIVGTAVRKEGSARPADK
jgi:SAM-dependent methyltransferase